MLLTAVSCGRAGHLPPPAADRRAGEEELRWFREYWLAPARVAPPSIAFEPRTGSASAWSATCTPARPEEAAWNQWTGADVRLFNNRAGYLFEVRLTGPGPVRWIPDRTELRLNGGAVELAPAASPEDLLGPLLSAAVQQERLLLDGDLVERTRGAGPFRSAYLPLTPEPELEGVILFPTDEPDRHVVDVQLTLAIATPDGPQELTISW